MSDVKDKVALVTGSSRGIGAVIATLFARHGAKVVIHGRDQSAAAAVAARIGQAGGHAIHLTADAAPTTCRPVAAIAKSSRWRAHAVAGTRGGGHPRWLAGSWTASSGSRSGTGDLPPMLGVIAGPEHPAVDQPGRWEHLGEHRRRGSARRRVFSLNRQSSAPRSAVIRGASYLPPCRRNRRNTSAASCCRCAARGGARGKADRPAALMVAGPS